MCEPQVPYLTGNESEALRKEKITAIQTIKTIVMRSNLSDDEKLYMIHDIAKKFKKN